MKMMSISVMKTVLLLAICLVKEATSSRWLILGVSSSVIKSKRNCDDIGAKLLNNKQVQICKRNVDFMPSVRIGAALALQECQFQFKHRRWNCTTVQFEKSPVFGNSLNGGTREAAFVHAISSAGVAWSVTRACSSGKLGRKCGCDKNLRGESPEGWTWAGCSDDIEFGDKFSKDFVDARERGQRSTKPYRVVMNLHNNVAGREAVKSLMKDECKCHGVSGSCNVKTCWRALPDFRKVGEYLKEKFNGATLVEGHQIGVRRVLVQTNPKFKPHTKHDLVYVDHSPDFCEPNARTGSLGTKGRMCNRTSQAMDGCDLMCCQRGYTTQVEHRVNRCGCKFYWCCYVKCQQCEKAVEVSYCK